MSWLQISFTTTPEAQEALEDALLAAGALSITYQDAADQPILEPGLHETPLWDELTLMALFTADADVKACLQETAAILGTALPPHRYEILEDKDWIREWMDSYKPIRFADNLWICPSWCEPVDSTAVNILLDPGLAFGTGTHPTTALCLSEIAAMDLQGKTVIDYGCGSGILAIAALLLGAKSAIAIDIDPQAISATRDNAERNGIAPERLQLFIAGEEPNEPCDIMLANILAGPLAELAPQLEALCKPRAMIVLSGLLAEQQGLLSDAYSNFNIEKAPTQEQWLCLVGRKKP
jgi:ribosomal protein L11 methyltransferase